MPIQMKSQKQARVFHLSRPMKYIRLFLLCLVIRPTVVSAETQPQGPPPNLDSLIQEAVTKSPLIIAARRHWEAEMRMPTQEATLPEPQINFQNMAVGNPIPGNELQTSDFAYFGYGISQDIPFPGKLRLRASVAEEEAQAAHQAYQAQQR